MVLGRSLPSGTVVEHGTSRPGRWLRARRFRFAGWIALTEGILLLVHAIPRLPTLVVAAAIVVLYLWTGRRIGWDSVRQAGWIIATSQALVLLVPVFLLFFWTLAIVVIAIIAVVALVALFSERA